MKIIILLSVFFSTMGFTKTIQCELTRLDYLNDTRISNSVSVVISKGDCIQGINIDDSQYGEDNFNYKICFKRKNFSVKIFPGESSAGNGIFKPLVAKFTYNLNDELHKEISLIQNVSIYCQ